MNSILKKNNRKNFAVFDPKTGAIRRPRQGHRQKHRPLVETWLLISGHMERSVKFDIYLPALYGKSNESQARYPLILFNDGQDLEALQLPKYLADPKTPPVICVGIFPEDRMNEYGTASSPDYKNRGNKAAAYSRFVMLELLPFLHSNFNISNNTQKVGIAGFSLGGLSAFDIAWNHPSTFGFCGVFSGALWWRSKDFKPKDPDADRIVHDSVSRLGVNPGLRCWFQTGTEDEISDRNNNGIIDSIDDTTDLIKILKRKGLPEKNIRYLEIIGGRHEPATWAEALPDFFSFTFAPAK
ncbi:MAG: esterase family protein [Bacteroidetes bacterium]|nr:esterase family protein [Bacteroidota bacterium]